MMQLAAVGDIADNQALIVALTQLFAHSTWDILITK